MIKVNSTLKEFLDTIDDSQYYMMAYKFSVQKAFESIKRDFNEWKKSMAPYEKEILKAANKFIGAINPKTGEEYSEIPDIHKNIPKFVKDWYWEGYFQPSEDEMALYFCIKYPDLKLFPSAEFKYWSDGSTDDLDFNLISKEEIAEYNDELTIDEYRELFNGSLTVEEYIKRHPLTEVL